LREPVPDSFDAAGAAQGALVTREPKYKAMFPATVDAAIMIARPRTPSQPGVPGDAGLAEKTI